MSTHLGTLVPWMMAGTLLLTPLCASTEEMDFSSLQLNGSAATVNTPDGVVLRLVPAQEEQTGSAFSKVKVNTAAGFSTFFSFRITEPTYNGAEGFMFVVQSHQSTALGEDKSGLGYSSIPKSVGVEFDTWANIPPHWRKDYGDDNHIAINTQGDFGDNKASVASSFKDGSIWYAWIDYDGSQLEVRINQTDERPNEPKLSQPLNLAEILGGTEAFVGFTSTTGGTFANPDILSRKFEPIVTRGDISYSPTKIKIGQPVTFKASVTETNIGISSADTRWTIKKLSGETLYVSDEPAEALTYIFTSSGTYLVTADIQGYPIAQNTITLLEIDVPEKPPIVVRAGENKVSSSQNSQRRHCLCG